MSQEVLPWARSSPSILLAVALGLVLTARLDAQSVTVTLNPDRDNTLYQHPFGDLSNGAGPSLFAGRTGPTASNSLRRAVLRFDVASALPPGATVLSAELVLELTNQPGAAVASFSLHRLLADWGEGASNASGAGGGGAPSQTGDATWVHRFYPGTDWTTTGGDYAPSASAVQSVLGFASHTWGPTAQMTADVQGWLDAPASNFGWILIGQEANPHTARRFDSREEARSSRRW
jgi:hypothetical protein